MSEPPPSATHPPAGITPAQFFDTWLGEAFTAQGCEAPGDAPTVRVGLSGAEGGLWEIRPREQSLEVERLDDRRPPRESPDIWIRQSTADFLATIQGDPDLPDLLPPGWGPLDLLFLDPADVSLVRQISGRLLVEILGKRRRRWGFDIAIGKAGMAAGRPRTTVRIEGATYDGLRRGEIAPLQALLERRFSVEGDRALAMQGLMLLGSRLSRGATAGRR